jgi:hypothetical protein
MTTATLFTSCESIKIQIKRKEGTAMEPLEELLGGILGNNVGKGGNGAPGQYLVVLLVVLPEA